MKEFTNTPTFIYQSNRLTSAHYDYSLIQERLMNAVIFSLQQYIEPQMRGLELQHLDDFNDKSDKIELYIPLKHISSPQQYIKVREQIKKLASIVVEIPDFDEKYKTKMLRYEGLFSPSIPTEVSRCSFIKIIISKEIAKILIKLDRNDANKPYRYTRFIYEVGQKFRCKYSSRIYKLIASWREKGEFTIKLSTLKMLLGIEDKYPRFIDFKKNVLLPVQRELEKFADCWFDCNRTGFVSPSKGLRQGQGQDQNLNFIILSDALIKRRENLKDYILNLLKIHFEFNDHDFNQIRGALKYPDLYQVILNHISTVHELDRRGEINNKKNYLLTCLQNIK